MMPTSRASQSGPRCHYVFTLIALMFVVCARVEAQTSSVTLTATVSETVALSIAPGFNPENISRDVIRSGNTVRVSLSSPNRESRVIRVPLLVRSNSGFKVFASIDSTTADVAELSMIDARATGTLVAPHVASAVEATDLFPASLVLTGPRVSLGGTLQSPNNALQITLLIRLQPKSDAAWSLQLTFVGEPER
ncbi:MAG TPA: hypothetical protein VFS76_16495 [Pyrinomonadaceae bacterium]|nr:hypothetical protein [Pyrinomonadaceae bacterium]